MSCRLSCRPRRTLISSFLLCGGQIPYTAPVRFVSKSASVITGPTRKLVRVKMNPKRLFSTRRLPGEPPAKSVGVSLQQAHFETLVRREKELNVGRSTLCQVLLEIEERDHVLRHELMSRLRRARTTATPPAKDPNGSNQEHQLENN
jgi:hypothetical protein